MVRTESIKRQSRTQRTRGRRARLGWRITGIIYGHAKVQRKIATTKRGDSPRQRKGEREKGGKGRMARYARANLFPATWQRRVCKLLPIWTSETGTRARLVRAGFTTVCFYLVLLLHPFFLFASSSCLAWAEISVGLVCIRCLDDVAKPTIYIPLAEFEAKLAVIVEGARVFSIRKRTRKGKRAKVTWKMDASERRRGGGGGGRKIDNKVKIYADVKTNATDRTARIGRERKWMDCRRDLRSGIIYGTA